MSLANQEKSEFIIAKYENKHVTNVDLTFASRGESYKKTVNHQNYLNPQSLHKEPDTRMDRRNPPEQKQNTANHLQLLPGQLLLFQLACYYALHEILLSSSVLLGSYLRLHL